MNDLNEGLKLLLKRTLLALTLFGVTRFLFLIFNPGHFTDYGLQVFIYGIRFDLSAFFYWYLPFIIISLVGLWHNPTWVQKLKEYLFYLSSFLILALNCIDLPYFRFTFKRSTSNLFTTITTGDDVLSLIPKFLIDFWYIDVIFILMLWATIYWYKRLKIYHPPVSLTKKLAIKKAFVTLGLILAFVVAGRGGLQLIPLSIIDASKYVDPQNVPLVLNTPFTVIRTLNKTELTLKTQFSDQEVDRRFPVIKTYSSHLPFSEKNIVFIVLESFSSEFLYPESGDVNLAPFISSLLPKSYVFTNCFANGKKSIEGIPSILSSIPSLMNNPVSTSIYAGNKMESIASILKSKGYASSFYHGGKNGTMNFDGYCANTGFDKYVGLDEYPNPEDFDGAWGIPDEPFLQFYAQELSKMTQPFVSTVFTLSSHHPFTIPNKYVERFNKGKTPLENTILYTDFSVQQFFSKLEDSEVLQNSIFIFTADHTSSSRKKYYRNSLGTFDIPFFIYSPGDSLAKIGIDSSITQQIDILPTVLDLMHYPDSFFAFGQSKMRDNDGFSIQFVNEVDQLIWKDFLFQFRNDVTLSIYDIKKDNMLENNLIKDNLELQFAGHQFRDMFRQQYNNRLIKKSNF